ncbi:hypothetical protein [Phytomonospora endophytica]|uniref:Polyketide cyclase n=1 Tax=Phytomonospora endophytica TaxID=714109 RepID=A0A841FL04_9ACTN|nr:hypothetical protein [Phytomonospora endophytica]MBB6032630.1 hypothetical protein [Phytomonospora endophytica]GIG66220.1 hypothetical protein Pen01_25150 [Phytomonospora endophytica]
MTANGREPMATVAGHLTAPPDAVAGLVLKVFAGPAEGDNLVLFQDLAGGGPLSGGPGRFVLTYPGGRLTVEVDLERRTVAAQGGWWYRGEYTVSPAEDDGTILTLRVYNVAGPGSRWAVPLANRFFRGFDDRTRAGFGAMLSELGGRLGCETRLL